MGEGAEKELETTDSSGKTIVYRDQFLYCLLSQPPMIYRKEVIQQVLKIRIKLSKECSDTSKLGCLHIRLSAARSPHERNTKRTGERPNNISPHHCTRLHKPDCGLQGRVLSMVLDIGNVLRVPNQAHCWKAISCRIPVEDHAELKALEHG